MSVAVIGTVGVPARYGGFETLAEQLARHTDPHDSPLIIYCQRSAYPDEASPAPFAGHRRVFVPLSANGGQSMVHDMLALLHAMFRTRARTFLVLGYSGAWFLPIVRLLRPGVRIVTNIDGMEWRRDKFGAWTKRLLRALEWCAVRFSHRIIADNAGISRLARALYGIEPVEIAYGGDHTQVAADPFQTIPPGYAFAVARVEPENNCGMIIEACATAGVRLVFVGNWNANGYGRALKARFDAAPGIVLMDPVYDAARLAFLRQGAACYVHGHSVGGTNPSLVEAIFHHDRLLSFACEFNRATLDGQGAYFNSVADLARQLGEGGTAIPADRRAALMARYTWRQIAASYQAEYQ